MWEDSLVWILDAAKNADSMITGEGTAKVGSAHVFDSNKFIFNYFVFYHLQFTYTYLPTTDLSWTTFLQFPVIK